MPDAQFPPKVKALLQGFTALGAEFPDGSPTSAPVKEAIRWIEARDHAPLETVKPEEVDRRTPPDIVVNGGALQMAINVLRRSGKDEIADELLKTAVPLSMLKATGQG